MLGDADLGQLVDELRLQDCQVSEQIWQALVDFGPDLDIEDLLVQLLADALDEVDVLFGFIPRTESFRFDRGEKGSTPTLSHHLEAVPVVSIPPLLNGPWVWSKCSLLVPNPAEMVLALLPP